MTSGDMPNAIFLPGPDSGASPHASPAGPTSGLSGAQAVRASRSRRRANSLAPMIQGICGRTYIGSSVPAGKQDCEFLSSWESRLRARLATVGSTESALIWREKTSPQGQSISRLARSTLHTNGTGSGGVLWRSPTAAEKRGGAYADPAKAVARISSGHTINLEDQIVALWPTPKGSAAGPDFAKAERSDTGMSLQTEMAGTAYWPTVTVNGNNNRKGASPTAGDGVATVMRQAVWSTPRASDGEKGGPNMRFISGGTPLPTQMYASADGQPRLATSESTTTATTALWVTPTARDWKGSRSPSGTRALRPGGQLLNEQMVETGDMEIWRTPLASDEHYRLRGDTQQSKSLYAQVHHSATAPSGPTPTGSSVTTAKRGAPNPLFACWLMGWPEELRSGVLRGILSFRSSRPKFSRRSSTLKEA